MERMPDIGDILDDQYEIVELMGAGGFGAVYRARQLNLDRDVALKVLSVGGPKVEQRTKRFRREVMAIRNLSHPNTVRIFDFRERDDGILYYTMEALDGVSLKELLADRGPMAPRRVRRIIEQILKSLAEAHAQGIIHRDLKPANVMLVEMHGETDFVKVLDFGIAKMLQDRDQSGEPVEELTSAGIMVGTPRYMAPEQILGDNLGPHTDLYGLGLLTMKLLTGDGIFGGATQEELIRYQLSDQPIEVPEAVADSALGSVMTRCLIKAPGRRFSRAEELLEELEAIDETELDTEPLYRTDGKGGWEPRDGTTSTVEPFEGMKTQMYDSGNVEVPDVGGHEGGESPKKTVDLPSVDHDQNSGLDESTEDSSDTERGTFPDATREEPDPTPEPRPTVAEDTGPTATSEQAPESRPPASFEGHKGADEGGGLNRIGVASAVVVVVVAGAFGGWAVLGSDDDRADSGGDSPPEASVESSSSASLSSDEPLPEEGADESPSGEPGAEDDTESEDVDRESDRFSVEIDVADDHDVEPALYVEEQRRGTAPREIEWQGADEVEIRLEADGYEPKDGRVDGEGPPVRVFEMEAEESPEPEQRGTAAGRGGGTEGTEAGAGEEPDGEAPDEAGAGVVESEPEVEDREPAIEPESDDEEDRREDEQEEAEQEEDDGWIDVPTSEDADSDGEVESDETEEGEEETDVPLF